MRTAAIGWLALAVACGCAKASEVDDGSSDATGASSTGGEGGAVASSTASSASSAASGGAGGDGGAGGASSASSAASSSASASSAAASSASSAASSGAGGAPSTCGNAAIEPGEDCEFDAQQQPIILATCQGLGFMSANLPGCDPSCHYDKSPCLCGDGTIEGSEACDGNDLGGKTCASEGFTAGTLTCSAKCGLITAACTKCGNGVVEPGETCDDGNALSGDGCSSTCVPEAMLCDPDGTYAITMGGPVSYSCCMGLVSVNVSAFVFQSDGALVQSSPSNPAPMLGNATTCPAGSFSNSASIPGGCAESYSLQGSFIDADTWSGTYTIGFTGPDCSCFGGLFGTPCIGQVFSITAKR